MCSAGYATGIRWLPTGQDSKKGALAGTIAANHTHSFTAADTY
jgi:hypothetical protein